MQWDFRLAAAGPSAFLLADAFSASADQGVLTTDQTVMLTAVTTRIPPQHQRRWMRWQRMLIHSRQQKCKRQLVQDSTSQMWSIDRLVDGFGYRSAIGLFGGRNLRGSTVGNDRVHFACSSSLVVRRSLKSSFVIFGCYASTTYRGADLSRLFLLLLWCGGPA